MDKLDYHVAVKEAQKTHGNRLADAAFNGSTFFMRYLVFDEYKASP